MYNPFRKKKKSIEAAQDGNIDFTNLDSMMGDEFSFDDDFGSLDDRKPQKPSVRRELTEGFKQGLSQDAFENLSKKTLPKEFTEFEYEARDIKSYAEDLVKGSADKLRKPLTDLAEQTKRYIPESFERLHRMMDRLREESEERLRSFDEREQEEAVIASTLASIFDQQTQTQAELEEQKASRAEARTQFDISAQKRNQDLLQGILAQTSTNTSFNISIAKEFYRKNLDLQMRLVHGQTKMLNLQHRYFDASLKQFVAISKNTALPDFVKLKSNEAYLQMVRQNIFEAVNSQFMSGNKYIEGVKGRLSDLITGKAEDLGNAMTDVAGAVRMYEEMKSMDGGSKSKFSFLTTMLGSQLGSATQEKMNEFLSKRLQPFIRDSSTINNAKEMLATYAKNPQVLLGTLDENLRQRHLRGTHSLVDDIDDPTKKQSRLQRVKRMFRQGGVGLMDKARSLGIDALSVARVPDFDRKLDQENMMSSRSPAIYDQKSRRSITHVIPLYLSRILRENTLISSNLASYIQHKSPELAERVRRNDAETESFSYNYNERKLDTVGNVRTSTSAFMAKQLDNNAVENTAQLLGGELGLKKGRAVDRTKTKALERYLNAARSTLSAEELTADNLFVNVKNNDLVRMINNDQQLSTVIRDLGDKVKKRRQDNEKRKARGERVLDNPVETKLSSLTDQGTVKYIQMLFRTVDRLAEAYGVDIRDYVRINDFSVDEKEAKIIQVSMTKYIAGESAVLTPQTLDQALRFVSSSELLISKCALLIAVVGAISRSERAMASMFKIARVLADIQSSITNMIKANPEALRIIYDLNPEIFNYPEITAGLMTNLNFNDQSNNASASILERLNDPAASTADLAKEMANARFSETSEDRIFTHLNQRFNETGAKFSRTSAQVRREAQRARESVGGLKEDLKNEKTLEGRKAVLTSYLNDRRNDVVELSHKAASRIQGSIKSLGERISKSTDLLTQKGLERFEQDVDQRIKGLQDYIAEKQQAIQNLQISQEVIGSEGLGQTTASLTRVESNFYNGEITTARGVIRVMTHIKTKLSEHRERLGENEASNQQKNFVESFTSFLKEKQDEIQSLLNDFQTTRREYLNGLEKAKQSAAESMATDIS